MEKEEKTTPETEKPKPDNKVEGVSNQINLGIGSATHRRFARLLAASGAPSARAFVEILLDAYENPVAGTDNTSVVESLRNEIAEMKVEAMGKDRKIEDLEQRLSDAINDAKDGLGKQLQLEELMERTDGAIIIKPHPVTAHFLNEMAERTGSTPARILESLYLADLQNPTVNNLPYTVTSREIRKVAEELKNDRQ